MSKPNKPTKTAFLDPKRNMRSLRIAGVVLLLLASLYILYDSSPFGGTTRYYAKWVECGSRPVSSDNTFLAGVGGGWVASYLTNSYTELQPDYFCTPLEAEKAGYSASSDRYYFPAMEQAGLEPCAKNEASGFDAPCTIEQNQDTIYSPLVMLITAPITIAVWVWGIRYLRKHNQKAER